MTGNKTILQDLKQLLIDHFGDLIQDVILFGSRAGECADDDSDYDILIVLSGPYDYETEKKIIDVCYEIDLKYRVLTDTHLLSVNEMQTPRGKQPIFKNALENGVYA